MQELSLRVSASSRVTPTIHLVELALEGREFDFKPGQYCLVELPVASRGREDHDFSIACAPGSGSLEFATRLSDSAFKKAFASLKEGDEVKVSGPFGRFVFDEGSDAVFLSGGIGITPLRSMLQHAVRNNVERKITLLFGNRYPDEIPFREELDGFAASNANIRVVHTVSQADSSWTGRTGRIDEELIRMEVHDLQAPLYYVCGPPGMVDAMVAMLQKLGIDNEKIKVEHFSGYK